MSTKDQIIQILDNLSERNLTRLFHFAKGLSRNDDNVKKIKEGTEND